ncbi:MAG: DUF975 family protein [Clostridia bacterium]|nr:DUF975 family protein [Clostridia bacterium]
MVASEIRANARKALAGKWGKAALLTLVYTIIVFVINFVCNLIPVIGGIILFVISTPISYGLLVSFMKLKRDEEVNYTDFLSIGFSSFAKVWGVFGNMILKMILPVCLLVVFIILLVVSLGGSLASAVIAESGSGVAGFGFLGFISFIGYIASLIYVVVKGYLYSLSYYILNDNPNMTGKEVVETSEKLMRGNRWRFFWLGLTFIGWSILAGFTFGIGMLWLMPYIMVAFVCFYEELAGKTTEAVEVDSTKTEE